MIDYFDFSRTYSAYEVHKLFKTCIWCERESSIQQVYDDLLPMITWFKCKDCKFSARFANWGMDSQAPPVDFFFHLDDRRNIQVVAYQSVKLYERNKVLKVLSSKPVSNLKELKELVNKYAVLI